MNNISLSCPFGLTILLQLSSTPLHSQLLSQFCVTVSVVWTITTWVLFLQLAVVCFQALTGFSQTITQHKDLFFLYTLNFDYLSLTNTGATLTRHKRRIPSWCIPQQYPPTPLSPYICPTAGHNISSQTYDSQLCSQAGRLRILSLSVFLFHTYILFVPRIIVAKRFRD